MTTDAPGRRLALGVSLAVVAGFAAALQSRVNGTLAVETGTAFGAAALSFGSGLVLLTLVLPFAPAGRAAVRQVGAGLRVGAANGGLRWWECLGGLGGAFYVMSQGLTVDSLGVAVFTIAIVAGQSVTSLLIDRIGLAPGGVRLVTLGRVLGPVLTLAAVVVVSGAGASSAALGLALFPLVAGALQSFQQALNGRVRVAVRPAVPAAGEAPGRDGGVLAATFVSFLVGTAALLVVLAVSVVVDGPPAGSLPPELLLYSGGLLGIVFIALQAAVVQHIGVLLLGLGMIAGQVVGALVLDAVSPGVAPPGLATYVGAALTLVAVAVPLLEGALRRR
ncbi:DMT family transporter [Isoptericola sp. NEAU-Y5]|uniref:DMT family transporter n=1 Tax=Isoptericola luteus TaxID=2879484 RepID=A0ABS7ZHD7_9MICO|nr:DMT family transporter [Isoptericola sp. NEAU-Y5]MCA5894450.1 DMT family transporter [Isoptericola sp. NEAU-Y5]